MDEREREALLISTLDDSLCLFFKRVNLQKNDKCFFLGTKIQVTLLPCDDNKDLSADE